MELGHQTTFNDHAQPSPTFTDLRTGVVDSLGWSRTTPRIHFTDDTNPLPLSELLNHRIRLSISDTRECTSCGAPADRSTCADCFGTPPTASCVFNPGIECTYQDCPFPEYKADSCAHDFIVYLAAKDRVKVGITRAGRRDRRWRGQGATHALVFATAPNRKLAGIIETCCTTVLPDHATSGWFTPLDDPIDALRDAVETCRTEVPDRLTSCIQVADTDIEDRIVTLEYPTTEMSDDDIAALPTCTPGTYDGHLVAVRGSVLATDEFTWNVRDHAGRTITIEAALTPDT